MRLIKPSFEIWAQEEGLEGVYKQIERAGRVCYKSEDKITDTSAKDFVDRMIKSGHGAMLEHGTVYLILPVGYVQGGYGLEESTVTKKYRENSYSKVTYQDFGDGQRAYVTTNYRVIIENDWLMDLDYQCEPTEFHEKRVTVKFICDRGVSHEFVRHRVMSFAQESTRYCNYSKDKFGGEVTFIIPCWLNIKEGHYQYVHETGPLGHDFYWTPEVSYDDLQNGAGLLLESLAHSEAAYQELLNKWNNKSHDKRFRTGYKGNPWTPQQARAVLPNSLKTELVMTGFVSDWNHFFDLRARGTTGAPHPQAKELAEPLMKEFIARKYINN